ncbi:hypothetical protein SGCOL_003187 [Colletotrichum sp. CLE4]
MRWKQLICLLVPFVRADSPPKNPTPVTRIAKTLTSAPTATSSASKPTVVVDRFKYVPATRGRELCWYDSFVDKIDMPIRRGHYSAEILKAVYDCQDKCRRPLSNGDECKYAYYVKGGPRSNDICLLDNKDFNPKMINGTGSYDSWVCVGSDKINQA